MLRFLPLRPIHVFEWIELVEFRSGLSLAGEAELRMRGLRFGVGGISPALIAALRSLVGDGVLEVRPEGPPGGAISMVAASYQGPRRGDRWERALERRSAMVQRTLQGGWRR